jgi:hypothetical protein
MAVTSPHVVKFQVYDVHDREVWLSLAQDAETTNRHIEIWLWDTYSAVVVDDGPGVWYVKFPDAESQCQFLLTWW